MRKALEELLGTGAKFSTWKMAHRAVLKHLEVAERARGWSYETFRRNVR
jgi:hypothetical protein